MPKFLSEPNCGNLILIAQNVGAFIEGFLALDMEHLAIKRVGLSSSPRIVLATAR